MQTGLTKSHLEQLRMAVRNSSGLPGAVNHMVTVHGPEALKDPGISVMDALHIVTFARMPDLKLNALRRTIELHSAVRVRGDEDQTKWLKFSIHLMNEMVTNLHELPELSSCVKASGLLEPMLRHPALIEPDGIDNIMGALAVWRQILSLVDKKTARRVADNMTGLFIDGANITNKLDRT